MIEDFKINIPSSLREIRLSQWMKYSKILEANESRSIRLTEKENNILMFLYKNSGNTVSRETLLHEVWGYNSKVTTHTLETHIYRLRQKIEDNPSNACFLITEPGGYKLHS